MVSSIKPFNFGVYVSNLNDVLKEEAEVRVQELLICQPISRGVT
jgi:hypothetical protein